jgi:hypothetical protein
MNRLAEVGRVTPCAPSLALRERVVAAVGAQRTARPTLQSSEAETLSYVFRLTTKALNIR